MTSGNLKQTRHNLGPTLSEMAVKLGYTGKNAKDQVRKMESGKRTPNDETRLILKISFFIYDKYEQANIPI